MGENMIKLYIGDKNKINMYKNPEMGFNRDGFFERLWEKFNGIMEKMRGGK